MHTVSSPETAAFFGKLLVPIEGAEGWAGSLLTGETLPDLPIRILLGTTSRVRIEGLHDALDRLGIEANLFVTDGIEPEEGGTAVARAVHKALHVYDRLIQFGYFNRHAGALSIVFAVDSREFDKDGWHDKPASVEEWRRRQPELEKIARGERAPMVTRSGYAALFLVGTQPILWTQERIVHAIPPRVRDLEELFRNDDNFEYCRHSASGLPTARWIAEGRLPYVNSGGKILVGERARAALYGGEPEIFAEALFDVVGALRLGPYVRKE